MTTPSSPRGVIWLLKRLGSSPKNRAIAGDILEEGNQGRPKSWWWRQALSAATLGSFDEIRGAKLAALLAALTGWACLATCYFAFYAIRNLMPPFLSLSSDVPPILALTVGWAASTTLTIFSFALSGWAVAKLKSSHQLAAVLAFLMSVILVDVGLMAFMAFAYFSVGSDFVRDNLFGFCLFAALKWVSLLIGGLLPAPQERLLATNEIGSGQGA